MLKRNVILVLAVLMLGLAAWQVRRLVRPDCIYEICVGQSLPDMSQFGPDAALKAGKVSSEFSFDFSARAPFADLAEYRIGYDRPALDKRVIESWIRVHRDSLGRVEKVSVFVAFAEGSYLWSPMQQSQLNDGMSRLVGPIEPFQAANWMRRYVWERVRHWSGSRVVGQVWPGTGGAASVRIDIGTFAKLPRIEK